MWQLRQGQHARQRRSHKVLHVWSSHFLQKEREKATVVRS